jgi:hypothetical protein
LRDPELDERVDLDLLYTELAEAAGRVGREKTPLFLATLTLAMMVDRGATTRSLELIAQAERLAMDAHRSSDR